MFQTSEATRLKMPESVGTHKIGVTFHSEIADRLTVIQTCVIKHGAISFTVTITPAVINLTSTTPHLSHLPLKEKPASVGGLLS